MVASTVAAAALTGAQCLRRSALHALQLMDLTSLNDGDTPEAIRSICDQAVTKHGSVAAVCVWPKFVAEAKTALEKLDGGNKIQVATVVNFPSGAESLETVVGQTKQAVKDGADEIDLVLPYSALIEAYKLAGGKPDEPEAVVNDEAWMQGAAADAALEMVKAVKAASEGRPLKVILESADLEQFRSPRAQGGSGRVPEEDAKKRDRSRSRSRSKGRIDDRTFDLPLVRFASRISIVGGADFLKTSTGKSEKGGASLDSAHAMLDMIREQRAENRVGIKISGGVRTAEDAKKYLDLAEREMENAPAPKTFDAKQKYCWAHDKDRFRFGASGLRAKLLEALGESAEVVPASGNPNY